MPDPSPADRLVLATRTVAVAALLGLVALGLAWELWLAPTGRGTLALKVLPLVAGRRRRQADREHRHGRL